MTFRLANPEALWALVPLILFASYLLWKRFRWPEWFHWRRFFLTVAAFFFCILGLSRPQGGLKASQPEPIAANLFIALDISNSMLAEDVTPNRLSFAILFIQKTLEQLVKPRVALFPFAASGFLQLPLTTDTFALSESLLAIDPTITSHQGTDLNAALSDLFTAIQKLENQSSDKLEPFGTPRVLLLSDGESHHPFKSESLAPFRKKNSPIYTVGVGTLEGGTLKDPSTGATVRSILDPTSLQEIAISSGGAFFSSKYENIPLLIRHLNQSLTLGKHSTHFKLQYEFFPFFFAIGLLLFLIEFGYGRWQYAIRVVTVFLILAQGCVAVAEDDQIKATEAYNLGLDQVNKGDFQKAAEQFEESALLLQNPQFRKQALYNLGNAFLKMGDPEQALESYQNAYNTVAPNEDFNSKANKLISENMALAAQVLEMMKQKQKEQGNESSSEGPKESGKDPRGPKQFQGEPLSEQQKQKLFDLITSEEKQTLRRLREQKRPAPNLSGKQW